MAKGNVLYENEKFLNEYDELRSKTRSERDNQAFQLKIKLRKSDSNSNSQTSDAATSSYYETATDLDPQISANYKIHIDDPDNNRSS
jgi:ribosome assembly protein YihI (activator of Der GTPase)